MIVWINGRVEWRWACLIVLVLLTSCSEDVSDSSSTGGAEDTLPDVVDTGADGSADAVSLDAALDSTSVDADVDGVACQFQTEIKYGMKWVKIPKGEFWMGCPTDSEDETTWCGGDEHPIHEVKITRDFWLSSTEVTQGAWVAMFGVNPSHFKNCGSECPVENITWWDAVLYCNQLSKEAGSELCYDLTGLSCWAKPGDGYSCEGVPTFKGLDCNGYRLPTEAEWEYAARGGTTTALYTGDIDIQSDYNAPNLGKIAWYGGNSGVSYSGGLDCSGWSDPEFPAAVCGTHPVGQKPANDFCLVDMIGNVWEWTWDWYGETYYQSLEDQGMAVDPLGPTSGADRVIRGGSWYVVAWGCRAADRVWGLPDYRYSNVGLRVARSIP